MARGTGFGLLAALALFGFSEPALAKKRPSPEAQINRALAPRKGVVGIAVLVRRPGLTDWSHVTGSRKLGGPALELTDEFRIASLTKTYVSAATLRLVEKGLLELADPIGRHLSPETTAQLLAGKVDPSTITISDLLAHRSGLPDYATQPTFLGAIAADPGRRWTRREQIALALSAMESRQLTHGEYAYSDTGYILAGEIIERASGQRLAEAIPALLHFDRLGLVRTNWEPIPSGMLDRVPDTRAHAYNGPIDTASFNPSFDTFGGGGLVSTPVEVLAFYEAMLEGRVFDRPETLAAMFAPADLAVPSSEGAGYGLGLDKLLIGEQVCWGHKGHWSTLALWCPEMDSGLVVTLNAAGASAYRRARTVVDIAAQVLMTSR